MKKLNRIIKPIVLLLCLAAMQNVFSQEDSSKPELSVNLRYFNENNSLQYLLLETKIKKEGRFQPLEAQLAEVYLHSIGEANLVGKVKTDVKGKAKLTLNPALKSQWDGSSTHKFFVITRRLQKTRKLPKTSLLLLRQKFQLILLTAMAVGL
ncbi:MAG: hypothetical protein C4308_13660 [Chitinophagaceae bacterium]